jgi:S1-C subfamily serine protease
MKSFPAAIVWIVAMLADVNAAAPRNITAITGAAADLQRVRDAEAQRVEVFARAAKAVVCIFASPDRGGGGSGVIIDPAGYGLSNFHVVQEFIGTRDGYGGLSDGKLYPLRVLGIDPGGDIVMFKLEGRESFDFAPLGDSDSLRVGQYVAAMGNPFLVAEDLTPTITLGIISGLHRYQEGQGNFLEYADCIQVSTSINPGNSGGPLFDMFGRVIGNG